MTSRLIKLAIAYDGDGDLNVYCGTDSGRAIEILGLDSKYKDCWTFFAEDMDPEGAEADNMAASVLRWMRSCRMANDDMDIVLECIKSGAEEYHSERSSDESKD